MPNVHPHLVVIVVVDSILLWLNWVPKGSLPGTNGRRFGRGDVPPWLEAAIREAMQREYYCPTLPKSSDSDTDVGST
jgi:hypothetical protein